MDDFISATNDQYNPTTELNTTWEDAYCSRKDYVRKMWNPYVPNYGYSAVATEYPCEMKQLTPPPPPAKVQPATPPKVVKKVVPKEKPVEKMHNELFGGMYGINNETLMLIMLTIIIVVMYCSMMNTINELNIRLASAIELIKR